MQMLFTKILIIFFIATSTGFASSNFIEYFEIDPVINKKLANRITQYNTENISLPPAQQKKELLQITSQLNHLNVHSDKAIYWFIRGLHYKNMASFYSETNDTSLASSNIKHKNAAYKKTIELANTSSNNLSAAIFSTMKSGLSEDLKIQATKNEIALGGNGDNDSYYWYLHWSNIDQLNNAGRQDEAKAAYKSMQRELKNSGMDMSIYGSLTKKIETQTLKLSSSQPKTKSKSPSPKISKEKPETKIKAKKYDTKIIVITSIAIFSILSLIGVVIYEYKRKNKKRKK